jgi:hypothetical protein
MEFLIRVVEVEDHQKMQDFGLVLDHHLDLAVVE